MNDNICNDTAIQDLSSHYQDVVKTYLKYGRHRTELHMKDVQTQIDRIINSRVLDSTYSQEDVLEILNNLATVLKSTIKDESQNLMYTNVELLRHIFEEADLCGLTMQVDVTSIESEESIQAIAALEEKLYPKSQPKTKLAPIKSNELITAEEGLKYKHENEQLREKLTAAQKHSSQMTAEKSSINNQLRLAQDEIKELKEANAALKEKMQRLLDNVSDQETKFKELSTTIESEATITDDKLHTLLTENKRLMAELEDKKDAMKKLEKELVGKINETTQFKNMKKILITKNEVINQLRKQLAESGAIHQEQQSQDD